MHDPLTVPCSECGKLHDLADLEPSLARPDAFLAIPPEERAARAEANKNFCLVRDRDDGNRRWFVRVLVPVPVDGVAAPCCWGVWSELSAEDYAEVARLWDDPDQCSHGPFRATLANDLDGYAPTAGLRGTIAFRDVNSIPFFAFDADVTHPFAEETRKGVEPQRVLEWLAPMLHRAEPSATTLGRWPFDQAPNVAAITTRRVIDEGLPVLFVVHYSDDDSWAFLCGTTSASGDLRIVSMQGALDRDPTLDSIADLPPGWSATREKVGCEWRRQLDPDE